MSAVRGTRRIALLVGGLALVGVTVATVTVARASQRWGPHGRMDDDEKGRAGPDSARVAGLLASLGTSDPLVCELIGDQIGNFWSDAGRFGIGSFADAPAASQPAKDSLHGRVSDPKAIAVLTAGLDAANPCVRRVAAKLLGRSRVETTALVQLLSSPQARVREAAAYALGAEDRKEARLELERVLKARSGPEAAMAAWTLGDIGDVASLPALVAALSTDDKRTRYAAAHAIGNLHDLEVAPPALVAAARSSDPVLRRIAAQSLADIHDPATLEVLIELVGVDDPRVRLSVVEALGNIGSAKAAQALLKAAKDPIVEVRRAAVEALGEIAKNQ
ncbi:MAG: HEAT repeat domain-containing protein [Gemmatimonadetes bacterium]|nr:HEAT repeat domain-containing protein [Gemmatimonadota bacterium]